MAETRQFRFSDETIEKLQQEPPVDELRKRYGGKDKDTGEPFYLTYLPDWIVIDKLNELFDYGWDFRVSEMQHFGTESGKGIFYAIGVLTVYDENGNAKSHFDVGTGEIRGSLDMAIKGSVSDCIKRCARQFGAAFGNTLYDKDNDLHNQVPTPGYSGGGYAPAIPATPSFNGAPQPMTPNQQKYLLSLAREAGVPNDELDELIHSQFGHGLSDLLKTEASTMIQSLQSLRDERALSGAAG